MQPLLLPVASRDDSAAEARVVLSDSDGDDYGDGRESLAAPLANRSSGCTQDARALEPYACPRCAARFSEFRGVRAHLRRSAKCRAIFEDLSKVKVVQRRCREAAAAAAAAAAGAPTAPTVASSASARQREAAGSATSPQAAAHGETSTPGGEVFGSVDAQRGCVLSAEVVEEDGRSSAAAGSSERPPPPERSVEAAAKAYCGVGFEIVNMKGKVLGRAVAEEKRSWRLEDGRVARKTMEGKKWRWIGSLGDVSPFQRPMRTDSETSTSISFSRYTPSLPSSLPEKFSLYPSLESTLPSAQDEVCEEEETQSMPQGLHSIGEPCSVESSNAVIDHQDSVCEAEKPNDACASIGSRIVGVDGSDWGVAVGEQKHCWRLASGRMAKKSTEGRKWNWLRKDCPQLSTEQHEFKPPSRESEVQVEFVIQSICCWLPLSDVVRSAAACKSWSSQLTGYAPLLLPPPQVDAALQFCLLEVLMNFDDARLPLPMSAIWDEMRKAGRRALANAAIRTRMEQVVSQSFGRSYRLQQDQFLREQRPHHAGWTFDMKKSGFRTLERFGKHFDGQGLVEVFNQRWHKHIHHSPNTRTCTEWLLTRVNRAHRMFIEHQRWRESLSDAR
eukprot:TRINITY_DN6742_c1_g1_i1.p1 TRINITY_DN6742_c1_g1~~TRINITY_DN6742_c1_g1_i1.p1  ORF type:complete len:615 (-),score=98.69 TRINITY_DN6742_c1_g1_i1:3-1847(-)